MKVHATTDTKLKNIVRQGLKDNNYYCPCIINGKGNPDYKCMCKDFRENTKAGDSCYCGLYIKDEE